MANDFVAVDSTADLANEFKLLLHYARELKKITDQLGEQADHMFSHPDYTGVEGNFGLAADKGLAFYQRLTALQGVLNGTGGETETGRVKELLDLYVFS